MQLSAKLERTRSSRGGQYVIIFQKVPKNSTFDQLLTHPNVPPNPRRTPLTYPHPPRIPPNPRRTPLTYPHPPCIHQPRRTPNHGVPPLFLVRGHLNLTVVTQLIITRLKIRKNEIKQQNKITNYNLTKL